MENVSLEPSQYYSVKSLNDVPTSKSTEDDAPTRDSTTTFGSTYLNHEDTRQYLYLLTPKENLLKELKSKVYIVLSILGSITVGCYLFTPFLTL